MIRAARPAEHGGGGGRGITLAEALEIAAERLASRFAGRPLAEMSMRRELGWTFRTLEDNTGIHLVVDSVLAVEIVEEIRRTLAANEMRDCATSFPDPIQRWLCRHRCR